MSTFLDNIRGVRTTTSLKSSTAIEYVHFSCAHCKREVFIQNKKLNYVNGRLSDIKCARCSNDNTPDYYLQAKGTVTEIQIPKHSEKIDNLSFETIPHYNFVILSVLLLLILIGLWWITS